MASSMIGLATSQHNCCFPKARAIAKMWPTRPIKQLSLLAGIIQFHSLLKSFSNQIMRFEKLSDTVESRSRGSRKERVISFRPRAKVSATKHGAVRRQASPSGKQTCSARRKCPVSNMVCQLTRVRAGSLVSSSKRMNTLLSTSTSL